MSGQDERRVRVKVCGITDVADAVDAASAGADLLGLNFWPPSPRSLEVPRARAIAQAVRSTAPRVRLVGVFVDRPVEEVAAIDRAVSLDLLQFHGHEPDDAIAPFAERAIKVFRVRGDAEVGTIRSFARRLDVWGYLFDHDDPVRHGGSGQSWRFESLKRLRDEIGGRPLLIAGGLRPETVAAAVSACAPWGVDVCSGIESVPGKKHPGRLRQFIQEIPHVRTIESTSAT